MSEPYTAEYVAALKDKASWAGKHESHRNCWATIERLIATIEAGGKRYAARGEIERCDNCGQEWNREMSDLCPEGEDGPDSEHVRSELYVAVPPCTEHRWVTAVEEWVTSDGKRVWHPPGYYEIEDTLSDAVFCANYGCGVKADEVLESAGEGAPS